MLDIFITFFLFLATFSLYAYLLKNFDYWKKRKVPYIRPLPVLGNLKSLIFLEKNSGLFTGDLYNAPEAENQRFLGIFVFNNEPGLILKDPELIKRVLVKDFTYFGSRYVECDEKNDPIGVNNLFVLRGPKWKYLRAKLNPAFSSGKIKQLFELVKEVAVVLTNHIEDNMIKENNEFSTILRTKGIVSRYTIDVISTCAFGIQSNALENPDSAFRVFGDKIFDMTITRSMEVRAFFFMHFITKLFSFTFLQKQSTEFFRKVFWEAIEEREKKNIYRNDFLDVLIKLRKDQREALKNNPESEDEIYEFEGDLLVAQPVLFFTAGFETTSSAITLGLYELALNQHVQDNLRQEMLETLQAHGGELNYEGLFEMKYLDKVVSEILRKYPPMPFIDRLCTKDYQIPDTDVIIRKGSPVYIPLYKGLHYDERFYPMPEKFDPERFSEENKKTRPPYTYIPFGEGPHICIGLRFGIMNVKTALTSILTKFRVEICEKTVVPVELDNRSALLSPKCGMNLRYVKL